MAWAPAGIGIDLGTSRSLVAICDENRLSEVIPNEYGKRTTPSYVAFTDSGELVGEAAKIQGPRNYRNTIFHSKRLIGRRFSDPIVQGDMKTWPFQVVAGHEDRPMVQVTSRGAMKALHPEEISAMVLAKMLEVAADHCGSYWSVVVTVPAYFSTLQRQAMDVVASISGLNARGGGQLRFLAEPVAAAVAYGIGCNRLLGDDERTVFVFDLGGGTLDVSVLIVEAGFFEVKALAGNEHLGGEDIDNLLVDFCICDFKQQHEGKDVSSDPTATQRLRTQCERAKCDLSSRLEVVIEVDALLDGVDYVYTCTRDHLEHLCTGLLTDMMETCDRCIQDFHESWNHCKIDHVVLVGGPTRMPKIREMLQARFVGAVMNTGIDPDETVALGAAMQAGILAGVSHKALQDAHISPAYPLSLGVEGKDGSFLRIIPANEQLPTKQSISADVRYHTLERDELGVMTRVFEGESAVASENRLVGSFCFPQRPPPGPISIVVDIDMAANIHVFSTPHEALFKPANHALPPDVVDQLIKDAGVARGQKKQDKAAADKELAMAKDDPARWGLTVGQLVDFFEDTRDEVAEYCRNHELDAGHAHVCLRGVDLRAGDRVCLHDLKSARHLNGRVGVCERWVADSGRWVIRADEREYSLKPGNISTCFGCPSFGHGMATVRPGLGSRRPADLRPMVANMHVMVQVCIRAMTDNLGYALTVNKHHPLKAKVFISHCWNEIFSDFVITLRRALPPNTPVWICSFSIPQNAKIDDMLSTAIEDSPFAKALRQASQVLLAVDGAKNGTIETLTRAWCVYESNLTLKYDKPLMVRGPNMSLKFYQQLLDAAKQLDVERCSASNEDDLKRILDEVRSTIGFETINRNVRDSIDWTVHEIMLIIQANVSTASGPR